VGIHLDDGQIGMAPLQRQDGANRDGVFTAQQEGEGRVERAHAILHDRDQLLRCQPCHIEVAGVGIRHVVEVTLEHRTVGFDTLRRPANGGGSFPAARPERRGGVKGNTDDGSSWTRRRT